MKKKDFIPLIFILSFININAQVLYSENFNSYNVGNLGTDPTGVLPGQGGWHSVNENTLGTLSNTNCKIQWESGRDLYLLLESTLKASSNNIQGVSAFKNIGNFWKLRNLKNNILQFEFEFNTNLPNSNVNSEYSFSAELNKEYKLHNNNYDYYYNLLVVNDYQLITPYIRVTPTIYTRSPTYVVKPNVWQKIIFYIDYNNYEAYIHFPSENYTDKIYTINNTDDALDLDFLSFGISCRDNPVEKTFLKIDNIKISAIETLPNLNIVELDISKFSIFPNPSKDLINITNSNNILINQVEIHDLSGKLILAKSFNDEIDVQLNIETLQDGTYLLHLKTNEGIGIKKFIKK